jgi:hypothetical protein
MTQKKERGNRVTVLKILKSGIFRAQRAFELVNIHRGRTTLNDIYHCIF